MPIIILTRKIDNHTLALVYEDTFDARQLLLRFIVDALLGRARGLRFLGRYMLLQIRRHDVAHVKSL